jgi:peptide/nickel transport system substrate-binding protein
VPYTATADDTTGTVRVTMSQPYGFLLNTIGQAPIVCAKGMRDRKILAAGSDGTGPFVLTQAVAGQSYTFSVRKGYTWGPGGAGTAAAGTPAKLIIKVVTNQTTAANLLLSKDLNFADIAGPDRQRLARRGLAEQDWTTGGADLWFNQLGGRPAGDERVRRALMAALDVNKLVAVSTGGVGKAATSFEPIAPTACADNTVAGQLPHFDPSAAAAMLASAGWTKTDNTWQKNGTRLHLDLHYVPSTSAYEQPTAELIAQQWSAIGVSVKLVADDQSAGNDALYNTQNWDVYLMGLDLSLPSQAVPFLSGDLPPSGNNVAGIKNDDYTSLANSAIGQTPPAACPIWARAERAIVHSADVVPISVRPDTWFRQGAQAQIQRYNAPIPTTIRVLR